LGGARAQPSVVPTVVKLLFAGFQGGAFGAADVRSTVHMRFVGARSLVVAASSTWLL
jgi:hypothetical protein